MRILVGVDPGHRSAAVVQLGELLARSLDAGLVVAAITPPAWSPIVRGADTEWQRYARDSANVVLDHAASLLADGVKSGELKAEFLLHEASSARRGILEVADDHGAALVVVGSSAAGPIGRITIGSEVDALLHASPVPVAIAPRGYRVRRGARITRVTAGYSGSDASADLVIGAAGIAADGGASLRLASFAVRPPGPVTTASGLHAEDAVLAGWREQMSADAAELLADISELPRTPASVEAVVGIGATWEHAMEDIEWTDDDVLVVGSSSVGPLARVFVGSHAAKVVRHSPVPVIVVPRGRAEVLAARAETG